MTNWQIKARQQSGKIENIVMIPTVIILRIAIIALIIITIIKTIITYKSVIFASVTISINTIIVYIIKIRNSYDKKNNNFQ